jgi:hypothetical protein
MKANKYMGARPDEAKEHNYCAGEGQEHSIILL